MIQFSCMCGHAFSVPDDRAGDPIQCPRCGILNDAPTATQQAGMEADGTIRFDAEPVYDPTTVADLYKVFTRGTVDRDGADRDQRLSAERIARVGDHPTDDAPPVRVVPRYDPVTGELIRPFALKDEAPKPVVPLSAGVGGEDDLDLVPLPAAVTARQQRKRATVARGGPAAPVAAIPVAALPVAAIPVSARPPAAGGVARPPSLGYAVGETRRGVSLRTLPVDLFGPGNATVMGFAFLGYVLMVLMLVPLKTFAVFFGLPGCIGLLFDLPLWLLLAHYGCTVEETGPEARDELPRPMRNFEFGADLIVPGVRVGLALALSFGAAGAAAWVTGMATPAGVAVTLAAAVAGAFVFPAVLLTALTGTTVLNLSPGRVLGTITTAGSDYYASVALGVAAVVPTVCIGLGPFCFASLAQFKALLFAGNALIQLPVLAGSVFVTHLFCWHLGLIYRAHHDQFPWLAQRHVKAVREGPVPKQRPSGVPLHPAARAAAERRGVVPAPSRRA